MDIARDLLLGLTVHHNYVNRHSRLDATPAEANGPRLELDGDARMRLIDLAKESHPD